MPPPALTPAPPRLVHNRVHWVFSAHVEIRCRDSALRATLREGGARRVWPWSSVWRWRFGSDAELAAIFTKLRDAGFAFAGASGGWPPSDVFVRLRERGFLVGRCQELLWRGPGQPEVSEL